MRLLLAIGCNAYDADDIENLSSAESDAQRIFDALLPAACGDYSPTQSVLLLSPLVDDVRAALRKILSVSEPIDTFTFYFAGHGSVRTGSFYMWLKDSTSAGLSMSAFALADLFRNINDVKPLQTNIIIDACESGGLINDLSVLLKSSEMGNANTPGITLLATSAQDEGAAENDVGGAGTAAILDCIQGREMVQDHSPTLDLVEIGRNVSTKLRAQGQSPVVWGLNLFGAPQFSRNPFSNTDHSKSMRILVQEWSGEAGGALEGHSEALWRAYASVDNGWQPRQLLDVAGPVFASLAASPVRLSRFAERLSAAMLVRAENSQDYYRPAEVAATLAVGLLPYVSNPLISSVARSLADLACTSVFRTNTILEAALADNSDALLSIKGFAFSELFYLPIRIARVLAWGAVSAKFIIDPTAREEAAAQYARLLEQLLSQYEGSIVAVSDSQAPHWFAALALQCDLGFVEKAEIITGLLFNSIVANRCNLVRGDATSEQIIEYLVALDSGDFAPVVEAIERPNETLTVLIRMALKLELGDVFDEDLWNLDNVSFMAYFCDRYENFGGRFIEGGVTSSWQVGYDFFRCNELPTTWPEVVEPGSGLQSLLVVLASLLFPDRVAWHLLR
ncbi:caspase family protein [Rugamonas sp. A1-17]|nr:caspase family protein [Rugamonas sp. A1-17]